MRMPAFGSFVLAALLSLVAEPVQAKAVVDSPYTYQQTFGTAVRLLKIDLDLAVVEKDAEWGYVLFEYTSSESGKRKNAGSFTFVKSDDTVQVSLQIPSMPSYHEQVIIQRLKRKLEEEHGEPPRRRDEEKKKKDDAKEPPKDEPKEGAPPEPK